MRFIVVPNEQHFPREGKNVSYLCEDNWNDYWDFKTLYFLIYFDDYGAKHDLGGVKIGQHDWQEEQTRPRIPDGFETLDERFFSLGQDADYYEGMRALGSKLCDLMLAALNDVAADDEMFRRARGQRVMGVSLMRSVNERTIIGQYRRIIHGGLRLTSYHFDYQGPAQIDKLFDPVDLSFSVEPGSRPPTNLHVIIGRNGVGKSFLINSMSRALVNPKENRAGNGEFREPEGVATAGFHSPFANVLSITFSAFDDFPIISENRNALKGVQYTNVGLQKLQKTNDGGLIEWRKATQEPDDLTSDFIDSAKVCAFGERAGRWHRALKTLEADPLFEEAQVAGISKLSSNEFGRAAGRLFRRLSSGHKIVLLTVTKLVEKTEERTLVLMDEPEAHLHPPLLSALIRALSDLLINRNGVAIIATHSPVVLQEVPRSCVWKIWRHGGAAVVKRPERETFAEHVGVLTHEVFGLEVTRSGFHKMLSDAIEENDSFDDVVGKFNDKIGYEGRALISGLIALRDYGDSE